MSFCSQLSVGHACLLFRCLHVASLSLLVVRVLESPRVLKLANGMRGDQAQILRSFEIGFQGCADVSDWFGSLQTASNEGRAVSLSKLGTDVLGVSTEGGAVMTMSDWKADHLSLAQARPPDLVFLGYGGILRCYRFGFLGPLCLHGRLPSPRGGCRRSGL